jgi:hypothetical protein
MSLLSFHFHLHRISLSSSLVLAYVFP